jgi:hypothetical protein
MSCDARRPGAIVTHATIRRVAVIATLVGVIAAGASGGALAGTPLSARALALSHAPQLKAGVIVLVTKRTVVPKIQRTVGFTGYATYTFSAPRGRRIVSASARITSTGVHAVTISHMTISHKRMRFTVNLIFPGEQGNPGKLVVLLSTIS